MNTNHPTPEQGGKPAAGAFSPAVFLRQAACLCALPLLLSGCVLMRGRDFGTWAQPGEKIDLVHLIGPISDKKMEPNAQIAILPIFGDMPQPYLDQLNSQLFDQAKIYFKVNSLDIDRYGKFKNYITQENLLPADGAFNTSEIGRLGSIMGVPYVLCSRVISYRLYPPQELVMHFILVDTATFNSWFEMKASYNASEQAVLILADRYLRARIGKPYNQTNLDILLRSPSQFGSFAAAHAMGTMAEAIWGRRK